MLLYSFFINCLDHNYVLPPAKEQIQRRDYMSQSLEDLMRKLHNLQRRKRTLAHKNKILLSKLEEVKDNLDETWEKTTVEFNQSYLKSINCFLYFSFLISYAENFYDQHSILHLSSQYPVNHWSVYVDHIFHLLCYEDRINLFYLPEEHADIEMHSYLDAWVYHYTLSTRKPHCTINILGFYVGVEKMRDYSRCKRSLSSYNNL